jgi:hypothetical protein
MSGFPLSTRGTDKATWTGYLVFRTGYLAMCVGPWCDEHVIRYGPLGDRVCRCWSFG